ncbi:MAG TPA: hypothetical protein VNJ08_15030 [Bacteriovoracaceae bacterium]|nr:hypothetical protein [Bacteriovoracaceae bacterium]
MKFTKYLLIGLLVAGTSIVETEEEDDESEFEEEEVARVLEISRRTL